MVFYFTGTGNSLYAAKQLEKDLVSISQVMRNAELTFSADQIGIAAPVYGHEVPPMVKAFLRKATFHTDYFYMAEQSKLDKKVEEHLALIAADIRSRMEWIAPVTDADRAAHTQFLEGMKNLPPDAWQHLLRVTDACTGCGLCAKVCPSASVRVDSGRAVHSPGNCQTCLACAHLCPQKAVRLNVPEKNPNARYRNPHITVDEIIAANHQRRG